MLHLSVDDVGVTVPDGASLLTAIRAAGAAVPALCHDDRLAPTGACRTCLVEVDGRARPVAACSTPAADGLQVRTNTPSILRTRGTLLAMLATGCRDVAGPAGCGSPFETALREAGLPTARGGQGAPAAVDTSHPHIRVDLSRCITCLRCVRICHEVQGQDTWRVWHRGNRTTVAVDAPTMRESSCVSCGACVDTCPTGALQDVDRHHTPSVAAWTRTVCPYCGTGCEMEVGVSHGRVVAVRPVPTAVVSKGHLCVKGRYAQGYVHADDRLTRPLLRVSDRWRPVGWAHAIDEVARRLTRIRDRHGPDAIGLLGSARATNEDNYVLQKFARVVIGTHNVDCCARVCHAPSAAALGRMLGAGAATNVFDDIERARTILVVGANVTENHPVVGARLRQAARRGAHLIVVDPRRIELADAAVCHLAPHPGTNVPLLAAMAHVILAEHREDRAFLDARVDGLDEYRQAVAAWPPERATAVTGVPTDTIRRAARLYASEGPSLSLHGLGLTEHTQGTHGVMALVNLALLTGNVGRPGAGVNPLRGQNNVQGAAHMGCEPATLTGGVPLARGRAAFEAAWGTALPTTPGLRLPEMLDAATVGSVRALWIVGYDLQLSHPCAGETARALSALDLVIVQDLFLTETARAHAHIVLPAQATLERDGTFMNAERRLQRVRRAVPAPGVARADWQIVRDVARAMGHASAFPYESADAIWEEIRQVWPAGRGITYARLDRGGLCWPCPDETHPGTDVLHRDTFAGGRARLVPVEYAPTRESTTQAFPLVLITGRTLCAFNADTMTGRTATHHLRPADVLDVSPVDARRLGVDDGHVVRVASRYGSCVLPVHVTDRVRAGELFATFHTRAAFVNRVTGPWRDGMTGTPEYKVTAVRVEPA